MPGITTRHDVFKRLDVPAVATELPAWAAQALDAQTQPRVRDGQARRGRSDPASAWWPWTLLRPAWCWRQRGGRTKEEPAETEEAHAPAKPEAERGAAAAHAGAAAAGGATGPRGRPLLPERPLSAPATGGRRLAAGRRGHPARSARRRGAAGPRSATGLCDGGHRQKARWAAAGAAAAGVGGPGRLPAGGGRARRGAGAGRRDVGRVLAVATGVRWPAPPPRSPRHEVR